MGTVRYLQIGPQLDDDELKLPPPLLSPRLEEWLALTLGRLVACEGVPEDLGGGHRPEGAEQVAIANCIRLLRAHYDGTAISPDLRREVANLERWAQLARRAAV